jgi:hypothetical protein
MFHYILFQLPEYTIPPTRHTDYSKTREYQDAQPLCLLRVMCKVKRQGKFGPVLN